MIEIQRITPILKYQENNRQNSQSQQILDYEKEKRFADCMKNKMGTIPVTTDVSPDLYQPNDIQFAYDSLQSESKLIKLKLI